MNQGQISLKISHRSVLETHYLAMPLLARSYGGLQSMGTLFFKNANQLASQLDLIHSLSTNFWDYTRECEVRFEALEKTEEPKVHLYTIKGWAKSQGIKSMDPQTLLKIDMMAKHYSKGRYMVSKVQNLNAYEPKPLGAAFDAILGLTSG